MPHISWSQMNLLWTCPQQYEFVYVQGLREKPGIALIIGASVHKPIENDMRHKLETGELLPLEAVQDFASDAVNSRWKEDGVRLTGKEADMGDAKAKALAVDTSVALASLHHNVLAPSIDPFSVEEGWEIEIPSRGWSIKGYTDITEKNRTIRDTKTSARSPQKTAADMSGQISMYALNAWVNDREAPIPPLALDFLVKTKEPKSETLYTTRTEAQLRTFLYRVENAIDVIESGLFAPCAMDSWKCSRSYCGFWRRCKYFSGRD